MCDCLEEKRKAEKLLSELADLRDTRSLTMIRDLNYERWMLAETEREHLVDLVKELTDRWVEVDWEPNDPNDRDLLARARKVISGGEVRE